MIMIGTKILKMNAQNYKHCLTNKREQMKKKKYITEERLIKEIKKGINKQEKIVISSMNKNQKLLGKKGMREKQQKNRQTKRWRLNLKWN